jgi:hypothetical protein
VATRNEIQILNKAFCCCSGVACCVPSALFSYAQVLMFQFLRVSLLTAFLSAIKAKIVKHQSFSSCSF